MTLFKRYSSLPMPHKFLVATIGSLLAAGIFGQNDMFAMMGSFIAIAVVCGIVTVSNWRY